MSYGLSPSLPPYPPTSSLQLTPNHQKEALEILTHCHPILMDAMCSIFDLQSCNKESQLNLIQLLLDSAKHKEAVTYAWKFKLQEHFSMEEVYRYVNVYSWILFSIQPLATTLCSLYMQYEAVWFSRMYVCMCFNTIFPADAAPSGCQGQDQPH